MTKKELGRWKRRVIADINRILNDYMMDDGVTYAKINMYFENGNHRQEKCLVWRKPKQEDKENHG